MIPADVFAECREKTRKRMAGDKPVSRVAAVVVVAVWLLCVALAVFLAMRVFRSALVHVVRGKLPFLFHRPPAACRAGSERWQGYTSASRESRAIPRTNLAASFYTLRTLTNSILASASLR